MNNSTNISFVEKPVHFDNLIWILPHLLIVPEYFNLIVLIVGVYGMYQGIEITHPLYAILFVNLIVPLCFTSMDLVMFQNIK